MRQRVADPATFASEAEALQQLMARDSGSPARGADGADGAESAKDPEDDDATLARLLGRSPTERPRARTAGSGSADVSEFIKQLVRPHVVPDVALQQEQLIASVDEATSAQMRALLHHPGFQELEAAWRGVRWLVTELELGEEIQLFLFDVSKQELAADLAKGRDGLSETGTYRAVVEKIVETSGGQPWSLLVGLYEFGMSPEELGLLAGLGTIGSRAGGPFVAAASSAIFGCRRLVETPRPADWSAASPEAESWWQALRASQVASWIGLAAPRVLLRLPYGAATDPTDAFALEEIAEPGDPASHEALLWGNPALACALLIAAAFQENGWAMRPGDLLDLGDLPAFSFDDGGAPRLQPVAEVLLTEPAAQAIQERGVMPLMSHAQRAALRLYRFQSIAAPATPLSGPWR